MVAVPSGMPAKWEEILAMFHDGTTKLPDRNLVAGAGAKKWITREKNGQWFDGTPADKAKDWGLDGYHAFHFPKRKGEKWLMFGFGYNWTDFGNDGGALAEFTGAPGPIFGSVVSGTNKDANAAMSRKASEILNNMAVWTDGWSSKFNEWAEKVGNGSEELQGESAELFEAVLLAVKRSLQETQSFYLGGAITENLVAVSEQLWTTIGVLRKNSWDWFDKLETVGTGIEAHEAGSIAMAFTHLNSQFLKAMSTQNPLSDHDPTVSGPNWGAIEAAAKTSWLDGVKTELDDRSAQTMVDLATAYDRASGKLSDANSVVKPTFTISLTDEEQKNFYGDTGDTSGGAGGGDDNDILTKLKEMFGAGGDGAGGDGGGTGGGAGGGDGGDLGLGGPPPVTGPSGSTSGTNLPKTSNLGLGPPPVTGPSGGTSGTGGGGSLTVPAGSRIDPKTGAVTDSKGKAVLGADGKPLIVPPGSTIGPGGKIISPSTVGPKPPTLPSGSTSGDLTRGFGVDAEGNVIVPKGTKVDAQGNLIGADGKPLTNTYGGKLSVPPGSRINADGTISDPQGKHITESSNNLKTRNPKTLDELLNGQRRPNTSSGDLFGGSKAASENLRKLFENNGNANREPTSVVSGISNRARTAMGLPAIPAVPPVQGNVPTQSLGTLGRGGAGGATGSGMPFMPPMGMGGGGAPGGGGSGGDRQRNVWLSEDEEVWGTEPGTGTGVIGR
ncbi:hypothetical protein OG413_25435 [Streptomyces sp. NBC_01433]|uniref:hypothetical protein n=1 Tax=Streptomyces sp. NBC_01433 TaxID=2903864 RepID=UPI00224CB57E|nr:hypothetical protein [Streptomyces sp. NBC_01433]MCX4678610.1 hypothetical protein [Streptomyces sp. NBC_01433]